MTTKHTPGPWSLDRYGRLQTAAGKDVLLRGVTTLCAGSNELLAEAKANTRLISAAPELLEACMAMLEWDDREKDHAVDFNARMELCRAAFNKARAAIRKARGAQ